MFDAFELEIVIEYVHPPDGSTYCEPLVAGTPKEADKVLSRYGDEAIRWFWTIYGHIPGKGIVALIDIDAEETEHVANVYNSLCDMLTDANKFRALQKLLSPTGLALTL